MKKIAECIEIGWRQLVNYGDQLQITEKLKTIERAGDPSILISARTQIQAVRFARIWMVKFLILMRLKQVKICLQCIPIADAQYLRILR